MTSPQELKVQMQAALDQLGVDLIEDESILVGDLMIAALDGYEDMPVGWTFIGIEDDMAIAYRTADAADVASYRNFPCIVGRSRPVN